MNKNLIFVYFLGLLFFLHGCASFNPPLLQSEKVHGPEDTPILKSNQNVKIMCWNVQYMAGKSYVFFYDVENEAGPDTRPSSKEITKTINEVARIIKKEDPDIILIQEIDDNAKRTDYENQVARLLSLLPKSYQSYSSAYYWKSAFVPHPKVWGRAGMKLCTISKYKIAQSSRHQLALRRVSWLRQKFELKRAILETRLPVENGKDLIVLNTHLSAFAQGEDTMQRQVDQIKALLEKYSAEDHPWIIGGDFNLLPPGAWQHMDEIQQNNYQKKTELQVLTDLYASVPSLDEMNGKNRTTWFTHYPNNPIYKGPDRTIDYIFYAPSIKPGQHYVNQTDTLHISDHMPVISYFELP